MEFYKSKYFDRKKSERNFKRDKKPTPSFRNSRSYKPSRYSRDSNNSNQDESTTVTCFDCGTECQVPFVPRGNKPVYCNDCFRQNNSQDSESSGSSRSYKPSRYSRDSNNSNQDESTTVTCFDCGTECQVPFVPRGNKPVYCSDCFRQNNSQDSESSGSSRSYKPSRYSRDSNNSNQDESTTVTCFDCGTECQVPFVPRGNKPVYCNDCFRQNNSQDSESSGSSRSYKPSRYSRDDKNLRSSSKRESSRDTSKSRKLDDKFLRKQEKFFSNGSDKFYKTIKEKLFEILGGKTCSNCGFKDERALGISTIYGDTFNDGSNGRGTIASSWGKYISAPQLAREELSVLCLNCNQIREPISKPKDNRPKSKKSRYFS